MARKPSVNPDQIRSGFKSIFDKMYHANPLTMDSIKKTFLESSGVTKTSACYLRVPKFLTTQNYLVKSKKMVDRYMIESRWNIEKMTQEYVFSLTDKVIDIKEELPTQPPINSIASSDVKPTEVDGAGARISPGRKVYLIKDNHCIVGTYYGYYIKDGIHKVLVNDEWRDVSEIFRNKDKFDDYVISMLEQVKISRNEA